MRSKFSVTAAVAAAAILCIASVTLGEEKVSISERTQIVEQFGSRGLVNWSAGYIEAVGIGAPAARDLGKPQARPTALRAAEIDAYRNLLETVNGVRVDSTTTVRNCITDSVIINTQVQGIIKGAERMKQEYMSDGTVEVTVRMPLSGDFSSVIMPRIMERRQGTPPPAAPPPAPQKPAPGGDVFTGLVVDARGIQARPAMSPRILDEKGTEVYGPMNVEREFAVQQGMSGYVRDLTAAQSNPRVTKNTCSPDVKSNPLTVRGLRVEGAGRSDIVIASADAEKVRSADSLCFLKKCHVVITLD